MVWVWSGFEVVSESFQRLWFILRDAQFACFSYPSERFWRAFGAPEPTTKVIWGRQYKVKIDLAPACEHYFQGWRNFKIILACVLPQRFCWDLVSGGFQSWTFVISLPFRIPFGRILGYFSYLLQVLFLSDSEAKGGTSGGPEAEGRLVWLCRFFRMVHRSTHALLALRGSGEWSTTLVFEIIGTDLANFRPNLSCGKLAASTLASWGNVSRPRGTWDNKKGDFRVQASISLEFIRFLIPISRASTLDQDIFHAYFQVSFFSRRLGLTLDMWGLKLR